MAELLNPFEATFDLLQNLRDEINELRLALVQERNERVHETGELKDAVAEARRAGAARSEQLKRELEDLRMTHETRFGNMEHSIHDIKGQDTQAIADLNEKLEMEIDQRQVACCVLDKALISEVEKLQRLNRSIAIELQDHKKKAEHFFASTEQTQEGLKLEVDKLCSLVRDNSMARDPHKHFAARPGRPAVTRSPNSSAMTTLFTPRPPSSPPSMRNQSQLDNPQTATSVLPELGAMKHEIVRRSSTKSLKGLNVFSD